MENVEPSIYVACLASYNNGMLHGEWIKGIDDLDTLWGGINHVLSSSPVQDAEEYAIHDYEGFEGFEIGEWEHPDHIQQMATLIEEYGELAAGVQSHLGLELKEVASYIEEHCPTECESEISFAMDLFDELYLHDLPENVCAYIDYDKFAYDLFISDYFSVHANSKVYVFPNY